MSKIIRLTLFKIPDPTVIQEAVQRYSSLSQDALKSHFYEMYKDVTAKDGKPYIQLASASPTHDDPRSQGVTMVARTVFQSKEDMDYYDNHCQAHTAIKAFIKPRVTGPPLVVYMDTQAH